MTRYRADFNLADSRGYRTTSVTVAVTAAQQQFLGDRAARVVAGARIRELHPHLTPGDVACAIFAVVPLDPPSWCEGAHQFAANSTGHLQCRCCGDLAAAIPDAAGTGAAVAV